MGFYFYLNKDYPYHHAPSFANLRVRSSVCAQISKANHQTLGRFLRILIGLIRAKLAIAILVQIGLVAEQLTVLLFRITGVCQQA